MGACAMSEKTEQPTPQRIRKAREDGQVAHSKDFTQTVLLVALFGYLLANAAAIMRSLAEMIVLPVAALSLDFDLAVNAVATQLLQKAGELLAPFIGIVIVVSLLVEFWQTGLLVSFKAAAPSGKKLNPVANLQNIFSMRNLVETIKSTLKILLLSALLYKIVRDALPALMTVPRGGLIAVGVSTGMLLQTLIVHVALGYFVIALADLIWQRRQYIKQLMMTK